MSRVFLAVVLLLMVMTAPVLVAHHSMAGGADCGVLERHLEQDYVKGRTDALIYHVDVTTHERGCEQRVVLSNVVGAGIGEVQGNSEQRTRCVRDGQYDAVQSFRYYFDVEIDPSAVAVTCSKWTGHD